MFFREVKHKIDAHIWWVFFRHSCLL